MLTGTVRHVFYVQIGNTTIRRKTEVMGDVVIEICRVFKVRKIDSDTVQHFGDVDVLLKTPKDHDPL